VNPTPLLPRPYPAAFGLVYGSFAVQPDEQTCGAAAIRHGLLLGGLSIPVGALAALLEIPHNEGTHYEALLHCLTCLGFQVQQVTRPSESSTADWLDGLRPCMEQEGAFLLPCFHGGGHWVCLGAWDGQRAWVVDSYYGYHGTLNFSGYTAHEFELANHTEEWEDCINVVRPGCWAVQYQAWLRARRALLRVPVNACATMEAAVTIAAHQYLNDDEYPYYENLNLHLPGGVAVSVRVENPGADAVHVGGCGVGDDRVLVFRRASGMLTGQTPAARVRRTRRRSSPVNGTLTGQTPPELVIRASQLNAAQLG
jgi:hypothetical protein